MSERRTKNAILLKADKLKEVDNFAISISEPKQGVMSLNFIEACCYNNNHLIYSGRNTSISGIRSLISERHVRN